MSSLACPSLRLVEPAGSRVVANLAALWGRDAALAARVESASAGDALQLATARDGNPTLAARLDDGRVVQLHSKYDPPAEAATLVGRTVDGRSDGLAYFVLGFGLGYHLEELLRRVPTTAKVWVIEPDADVLRAAVESRDVATLLADKRVRFIDAIDRPALLGEFQPLAAHLHPGVGVVEHGPSLRRRPDFFADAKAWVDELRSFARTAMHTLVLNAGRTLGNITRNLPWYAASPGPQRLANAFRGEPAIVVSAGPSLRKNKHLLRDARGKAVIIAVQTTLKPLLEIGVEPDFVTALDYSDISTRFFQDLPRGLKTELVAEAKASDAILGLWPGPVTLIGNELADDVLRDARGVPRKARLRSGATVAHLAFYLAEYLGCDPIVFVGQDLGFGDGLCYTPGTSYDDVWRPELNRFCTVEMKQWEQIVRERPILRRIEDHAGRPMYTEQRLFTYLQQFEREFAASKSRIIDASEGGAAKRGAMPMRLADVLERHCRASLRGRIAPHAGLYRDALPDARQAIAARLDEAVRMSALAAEVLPLLEEIRDHLDDQPRVNRAIARIDPLRERMNGFGRTYDLVMYLAQQDEFERFKCDLAIAGREQTPVDVQRRQTQRDINNVRAVVAAAGRFAALMRESLTRVDAWREERS